MPETPTSSGADNSDERATLLRLVEQLAQVMMESGMPPMPARVLAFALADDADIYTAGDLAAGLEVSPAAISGAVRYLVQAGLLGKDRIPGDRRDHYRVYDNDVWGTMLQQRLPQLNRWIESFSEGARVLGTDRPGGRRMLEGKWFFEFMTHDNDHILERWQAYREARRNEMVTDEE